MKTLKKATKILIGVVMPLIMLVFIVLGVELFSGDRAWLRAEYEKLDINSYTGMSTNDMVRAFMQMVDYMQGDADSMHVTVTVNGEETEMYNEREISHMVDVRALYKKVMIGKGVVIGLAALALLAVVFVPRDAETRRELLRFTAKAAIFAFVGILIFLLALGLWAAVDFDSFWAAFHVVFLDLESSTFDPAVSRMIRICPAELFADMVLRIFIFGLGLGAATALAGALYLIISKRREKKAGDPART